MDQAQTVSGARVLVADDASVMRMTCQRALESAGYEVLLAADGEEALELFKKENPPVSVLDIRMPGLSGIEALREIKRLAPEAEVIMMTAYADQEVAEESLNLGASELLVKPFNQLSLLINAVHRAFLRSQLRRGRQPNLGPAFEALINHANLIGPAELEQAKKLAQSHNLSLREALLRTGAVSSEQLDWAEAEYLGLPYVRVNEEMLDPGLIASFPARLARKFKCLPVLKTENELHLVADNPLHSELKKEIKKETGMEPELSKGFLPEIEQLIERFYGPEPEKTFSEIIAALEDPELSPSRKAGLLCRLFSQSRMEALHQLEVAEKEDGALELRLHALIKPEPGD